MTQQAGAAFAKTKKPTKVLLIFGSAVAAVALGVGYVAATLPDLDRLIRTSDAFPAPATWSASELTSEPARYICLGGNACPSTQVSWAIPADTTQEDFEAVLDATGWNLTLGESCTSPLPSNGDLCRASGEVDGVQVQVFFSSAGAADAAEGSVSLFTKYP